MRKLLSVLFLCAILVVGHQEVFAQTPVQYTCTTAASSMTVTSSNSLPWIAVPMTCVTPTPTPTPTPKPLPPMGVYNSCEPYYVLSQCESNHSTMLANGISMEINYNAIGTNKANLISEAQYDAGIGFMQFYSIKQALSDSDPLTGTSLLSWDTSTIGADCGATNNQQVIQCIDSAVKGIAGFKYGWYIYDEPGCPEAIGYCNGSGVPPQANMQRIEELAAYISSISTAPILGIQVGGNSDTASNQNFFTCNGAGAACSAGPPYYFITSSHSPNTGGDDYPIGASSPSNPATDAGITQIGANVTAQINVIRGSLSGNVNETYSYVGQAFSWAQEGGNGGCTSLTVCPYPNEAQIQRQRDEALWSAQQAGLPLKYYFLYAWPDINCHNGADTPCVAANNLSAVKAALTAPFPTTAP